MTDTYCGKNCEECASKEALNCPGCKSGPGSAWSGDCEIAKCRKDKGHETCETCSYNTGCYTLRKKDGMPEARLQKRAAEAERKEQTARSAAFFGKWLWILFLMAVSGAIAGLIGAETVAVWFPALLLPGQILETAYNLAYGLILLKLAVENDRYRTAGICCLIGAGIAAIVAVISGGGEVPGWTLVFTLPATVVSFVGEYHEYMGHSEALRDADPAQSEQWRKLWKWYIGSFAALVGSIIVILIVPILGVLVVLAAAIAVLAISIMKLVYLYRAAKLFREYGPPAGDANAQQGA